MASAAEWRLKISENINSAMGRVTSAADKAAARFGNAQSKIDSSASAINKLGSVASGQTKIVGLADRATASYGNFAMKVNGGVPALKNLASAASSSMNGVERSFDKAKNKVGQFNQEVKGAGSGIMGLIGPALAGVGLAQITSGLEESAINAQSLFNSLKLVEGGAKGANDAISYIKSSADKFGLSYEAYAESYKMIGASARGTSLQGKGARDIQEGVSMAASTLGMAPEQAKGALLAISQMISKGKVSAEELRGQLGERLPGAFQIAARAMNMNTAAFDKMMSEGKVLADDFLPKFASQLKKEFSASAAGASDALQSNKNRMIASFDYLRQFFSSKLTPSFNSFYKSMSAGAAWVKDNWSTIVTVVKVVGSALTVLAVAYSYVAIQAKLAAWWISGSSVSMVVNALATGGLTAAWKALNFVMRMNPFGMIVTAIALLVGAVVYCWDTFEGFRGFIYGLWESIKVVFTAIGDIVTRILGGVADMIMGVINFDWDQFSSGAKKVAKGIFDANPAALYFNHGKKIGEAFTNGYGEGTGKFQKEQVAKLSDTEQDAYVEKFVKEQKKLGTPDKKIAELLKGQGYDSAYNRFGENQKAAAFGDSGKSGTGVDETTAGINSVMEGGKSVRNINVNIGSLVKEFIIQTTNIKGSDTQIKNYFEELLLRSVNGSEHALSND